MKLFILRLFIVGCCFADDTNPGWFEQIKAAIEEKNVRIVLQKNWMDGLSKIIKLDENVANKIDALTELSDYFEDAKKHWEGNKTNILKYKMGSVDVIKKTVGSISVVFPKLTTSLKDSVELIKNYPDKECSDCEKIAERLDTHEKYKLDKDERLKELNRLCALNQDNVEGDGHEPPQYNTVSGDQLNTQSGSGHNPPTYSSLDRDEQLSASRSDQSLKNAIMGGSFEVGKTIQMIITPEFTAQFRSLHTEFDKPDRLIGKMKEFLNESEKIHKKIESLKNNLDTLNVKRTELVKEVAALLETESKFEKSGSFKRIKKALSRRSSRKGSDAIEGFTNASEQ